MLQTPITFFSLFSVHSYGLQVLDWLEEHLCLDTTHIWAQGSSNGGMFTYDLAVDSR